MLRNENIKNCEICISGMAGIQKTRPKNREEKSVTNFKIKDRRDNISITMDKLQYFKARTEEIKRHKCILYDIIIVKINSSKIVFIVIKY